MNTNMKMCWRATASTIVFFVLAAPLIASGREMRVVFDGTYSIDGNNIPGNISMEPKNYFGSSAYEISFQYNTEDIIVNSLPIPGGIRSIYTPTIDKIVEKIGGTWSTDIVQVGFKMNVFNYPGDNFYDTYFNIPANLEDAKFNSYELLDAFLTKPYLNNQFFLRCPGCDPGYRYPNYDGGYSVSNIGSDANPIFMSSGHGVPTSLLNNVDLGAPMPSANLMYHMYQGFYGDPAWVGGGDGYIQTDPTFTATISDVYITSAVPEPSTWVYLVLGFLSIRTLIRKNDRVLSL